MFVNKVETNSNISYSITDIDEKDLQCIFNSLTVAHLPDKQYLAALIQDIKQFI